MSAITHYSTSTSGIGGVLRKRIADFIVEEIASEDEICEVGVFTDSEKKTLDKKWPAPLVDERVRENQLILKMEKFNVDTANALRRIARALHTSRKRIGFAGMKDKRAITCQRISVWKADVELLKAFDSRYIDLREAQWADKRIEIGDLIGNKFTIIVRNIQLGKEELEKRINASFGEMKNGIANYFGEQRFGGIRGITHLVGKEFILGNVENAVMLYLTAIDEREEEDIKIARKNLADTKDFSRAINEFPPKYRYERIIIHHLCKYPKDFVGAFSRLPKSLTYMFTHAYQSHLFNQIINKRIETGLGLNANGGDVLENGVATAQLFGFESKFSEGKIGEIEREVLAKEGIKPEDFYIKEFPQISSKGARKAILLFSEDLKLEEISNDEYFEGALKAKISFRLDKGNYATTVLRELMKPEQLKDVQENR
ncbi:MAG: tRNA pseudouridine(13) synthase TruD [Candidatus Diapherotrites archaeon]|uniref:Probable tRNA pseudouridine synthase D n=1 Tax=Candidatus Iainarchaeum sp. TaxID=3101447 RepID=A0A8T4KZ96_9ARCH|nr:tRNA pseudouridine(13) synthase TruD [Candidatus Diapherotrites archaeon]